jgi:hypothetical protein
VIRHDERMFDSAAKRLLAKLDPLDYPARMRLLAAEALRLAAEGGLDAVLDDFGVADAYQRELALTIAKITRRPDRLIGALSDPLFRIRALALFACVEIAAAETDAAVLATLVDAPIVWRRKVSQAVSAAKRTDLADRLAVSHRAEFGEPETARLLPVCSSEVAAELLPGLVHDVPNWTRLGARHPALVLDFARRELAAMPPGSRGLWWGRSFGDGLVGAAAHLPLRVLDLLEEFPVPGGLPHGFLRRIHLLARADEGRTLRLLTVPDGQLADRWRSLTRSARKTLAASGRPEVVAAGRALQDSPAAFAELLRALPPGARGAFYDAVTSDRESDRAILDPAVLDALPHERRHAEARRMLALSALADRPDQRLAVVARLPWVEALPELRAAVRRTEAEERAAAYPLLAGCAAAEDRAPTLTELLTGELGRLRNEQDPVRRAALTALAAVPARLFEDTAAVADVLRRLVTDALEARDCSWATRNALRLLASRVLARQAVDGGDSGSRDLLVWALAAFEQLAGSGGDFRLDRLDRNLRRGQEFAVYQALEPWLVRGIERGDHRLALGVAQALGRRARAVPALQDALAHAIWHGTMATARTAIDLWLSDPTHRDERVAKLVEWDPTTASIYRVAESLSARRTDLLDHYLTGKTSSKGRFVANGVVWVPRFQPSGRWLPRQSAAYARLLSKIAADPEARLQERVVAINGLGALPGEGQREVLRYLDATEIALAEAALRMLAWSDNPAAALPVLFGFADGDRARVAVYAAARAARFARPSATVPILRSVALSPSAKVTSRKEALRIAADLDTPGVVDLLEEVWRTPGQHRDVKAAAVSRLAGRMDDARVPALLREAVNDDPAVATQLLRMHPLEMPERHRAAYGALVAAAVEITDPKTSSAALAAAPQWYRWTDSVATAVCAAVIDLDRRGDRTAPPSALFALLSQGMPIARYQEVLDELRSADARDGHDDGTSTQEQDRPARRRLVSIALAANAIGQHDPVQRRPVLQATVHTLTGSLGYQRLILDLAAGAVELDVSADELKGQLLELVDRANGRRDAAARAGERLSQKITKNEPWNPTALLAAVEALARRDEPEAGLIAVRLVGTAGTKLGWPGPFRLAVKTLRHHPDPEVAEAALDVNTGSA